MNKIKSLSLFIVTLLIFSIGCSGGCLDDDLTNKVAKPAFSVASGTYYDLTISCATEDAVVKYTIDGSDPETSETAVQGTSLTIDLFTTVKACATKEGLLDSGVSEFKISPEKSVRFITYNTDSTVGSYYNDYYDCNGSKMTRVTYSGKGSDNKWFTDDDTVASYLIYVYENGKVVKEVTYTTAGTDGTWITADDTAGDYITYTYSGDELTRKETYNSSDVCQGYTGYVYTDSRVTTETRYNAPGADSTWFAGDDDVIDYYYTYTYDGDVIDTREKYDASNTLTATSTYQYTGNTLYADKYEYDEVNTDEISHVDRLMNYGSDTVDYTSLFEYTDGAISKETKHQFDSSTEIDYYFNYLYTDTILTRTEKYSEGTEKDEYTEYVYTDGKKTRSVIYIKPDPEKKKITWNITITAGAEDGGYYTSAGINYDLDGVRIGDYDIDDSDFVTDIKDRVKRIIDNSQFSKDTGLTVYGLKSGSCVITAAAAGVSSSGYVKVKIKFSGFDDGDGIIINGTITKELEGSITLDGNLTGSLNGTFTGCLTITASNPSWNDSEYLMAYYTEYEYDVDDKIVREDVYTDAGEDGTWFNGDDTLDYSIDYTYVSDKLDKKTVKDDYGVFIEIKDAADTTVGYTFEYEVEKE